jgi:hypothetical protein
VDSDCQPATSCCWLRGSCCGGAQCSFECHFVVIRMILLHCLLVVSDITDTDSAILRTVLYDVIPNSTLSPCFTNIFASFSVLPLLPLHIYKCKSRVNFYCNLHALVVDACRLDHLVLHFPSCFCSLIVLYVTYLATVCQWIKYVLLMVCPFRM